LRNILIINTIANFRLLQQPVFTKNLKIICETDWLRVYLQPISCNTNTYTNEKRHFSSSAADPTRRAIMVLIAFQAMTPNAIAENFNTTRQAVSKHLRILTECELVKQEQKGREIYYSLEVEKMKEIDMWIEQFRASWETRFNQLDTILSKIKKTRNE
jgi:DNA-binding transcriptional ArsR family regulator